MAKTGVTEADIAEEAKKQQKNAGAPPASRLALFLSAALGKDSALADAKKPQTLKVLQLLATGKDAPTPAACQEAILRGVEAVVMNNKAALLKFTPALLQIFYEADLTEEAAVNAWYNELTAGGKKVKEGSVRQEIRSKAKVFVDWLNTADEEEEEEEDDE